jgi:hypothetical protein
LPPVAGKSGLHRVEEHVGGRLAAASRDVRSRGIEQGDAAFASAPATALDPCVAEGPGLMLGATAGELDAARPEPPWKLLLLQPVTKRAIAIVRRSEMDVCAKQRLLRKLGVSSDSHRWFLGASGRA